MCLVKTNNKGTTVQICNHKYGSEFCDEWKEI
jgi:hypothetical protein